MTLQTGQGIMFAPNALAVGDRSRSRYEERSRSEATVKPLGVGYFLVQSRARVTIDGGYSLLSVSHATGKSQLRADSGRQREAGPSRMKIGRLIYLSLVTIYLILGGRTRPCRL